MHDAHTIGAHPALIATVLPSPFLLLRPGSDGINRFDRKHISGGGSVDKGDSNTEGVGRDTPKMVRGEIGSSCRDGSDPSLTFLLSAPAAPYD